MFARKDSDSPLVQKLIAGKPTICLPIRFSRSIHVLQMAKVAGFDAIYMDMEHSPITMDVVSSLGLTAWNMGITPLVRVPSHDPEHMVRALEGGVAGIIVPHVNTAEQAKNIVGAARFRPVGSRAMAGASPPLGYAPLSSDHSSEILDARTIVIVMVESSEGVANSDEICAVNGIDMVLVGTGDLSSELGVHGEVSHPKVMSAYGVVAESCRRHGVWLGVAGVKGKPDEIKLLRSLGATFITSSTDETLLLKAVHKEANDLKSSFVEV